MHPFLANKDHCKNGYAMMTIIPLPSQLKLKMLCVSFIDMNSTREGNTPWKDQMKGEAVCTGNIYSYPK